MKYVINGKTYTQKKLVLGQIGQLAVCMNGLSVPSNGNPLGIIMILGDRLNDAIAVVLREEGKPLKDKDLAALSAEIEEHIDAETQLQVVRDFFDCNPITFLLETLPKAIGEISDKIGEATRKRTVSESSSASSAKGTSQDGTTSSGDTP